ncbi:hypothetical protein V3C99_008729 [Haemonchus contortus]
MWLLRTLGSLLLILEFVSGLVLFKESQPCNSMKCPSTMFYYFECCSGECCIRIQPIPSFLLTAIAIFLAFVCCLSCCCYCCCRN